MIRILNICQSPECALTILSFHFSYDLLLNRFVPPELITSFQLSSWMPWMPLIDMTSTSLRMAKSRACSIVEKIPVVIYCISSVEVIEDTKIPNAATIKVLKQDHTLGNMLRAYVDLYSYTFLTCVFSFLWGVCEQSAACDASNPFCGVSSPASTSSVLSNQDPNGRFNYTPSPSRWGGEKVD